MSRHFYSSSVARWAVVIATAIGTTHAHAQSSQTPPPAAEDSADSSEGLIVTG